jgi:hypothetical protein
MSEAPESIFRISSLLGGLGGLTKKKPQELKTKFIQKALNAEAVADLWKVSVADRMRYLDDLHKHAPLPEECEELNIPDDRLDLHTIKDILFLCGGCAGVRFTSEDFATIHLIVAKLVPLWEQLEKQFKEFDNASKKRILKGGPYRLHPSSSPSSSSSSSSSSSTGGGELELQEASKASEAATVLSSGGKIPEEDNFPNVILFHQTAESYIAIMLELQQLLRSKKDAIAANSGAARGKL